MRWSGGPAQLATANLDDVAGFELRVREPDHRMSRTPQRDLHLHVYATGRAEERDYLDLRDWLRISSADRRRYENVKRDLAQKQGTT